jgi:hypothetical protein
MMAIGFLGQQSKYRSYVPTGIQIIGKFFENIV